MEVNYSERILGKDYGQMDNRRMSIEEAQELARSAFNISDEYHAMDFEEKEGAA